jgi:ubiquinone/menaquinone biosynthesis C-methylase UbiE
MQRVVIPELLDSDAGTPEEVRAALRDLRLINRCFGGTSTTASLLRRIAEKTGKRELSVLDVGAGPGDSSLGAADDVADDGIEVRVTLMDRAATHMPRNGIPAIVGDALELPFTGGSFDVVTSCLFVHHLEPAQVVQHMGEALRVCRVAAVINDLNRSAAHVALVYAGLPLFRSRITWHDAPASVRRAYTPAELREILERTGAARLDITAHYLFRIGAIAWKEPPGLAKTGLDWGTL